jgi:hypothetical protein
LREVLPNFCQQLAWAKRFRHIVIAASRACLLFFALRAQSCRLDSTKRAAKLLSKDEARRIAANIAKLSDFARKAE